MALCINQSGTWRNITTQCVNQSGVWRNIVTGCINQSGTWREFGFVPPVALGDAYEGGNLICESSGVRWVVAPQSAEVCRRWIYRSDAVTRAQGISGCTGWFVPNCVQIMNPGYNCRTYWEAPVKGQYWSDTQRNGYTAWRASFYVGAIYPASIQVSDCNWIRAFRCVTY